MKKGYEHADSTEQRDTQERIANGVATTTKWRHLAVQQEHEMSTTSLIAITSV